MFLQFLSVYFCIFISAESTPKRDESVAKSRAAFGGGGCCCFEKGPLPLHHSLPLPLRTLLLMAAE